MAHRAAGGELPLRPKGRYVFCGIESSAVQRLDLADGKRVVLSDGHESRVFLPAFSADGEIDVQRRRRWADHGPGDRRRNGSSRSGRSRPIRAGFRALAVSPDGTLGVFGGQRPDGPDQEAGHG